MESINENSDEFYRKKYLKYKQKYIDTLQLYSKELDGGRWGDKFFILVPYEIYMLVRGIYSVGTSDKPTIIDNIKGFYILLGANSYKTFFQSPKLKKLDGKIQNETFWIGNKDDKSTYLGLGYFSDKDGKNKRQSMQEAEIQARKLTYGASKKSPISGYRFFIIESVKQGDSILGSYSIRFPIVSEQEKKTPEILGTQIIPSDVKKFNTDEEGED